MLCPDAFLSSSARFKPLTLLLTPESAWYFLLVGTSSLVLSTNVETLSWFGDSGASLHWLVLGRVGRYSCGSTRLANAMLGFYVGSFWGTVQYGRCHCPAGLGLCWRFFWGGAHCCPLASLFSIILLVPGFAVRVTILPSMLVPSWCNMIGVFQGPICLVVYGCRYSFLSFLLLLTIQRFLLTSKASVGSSEAFCPRCS